MSEVEDIVLGVIKEICDQSPNQWIGQKYEDIRLLEIDARGGVGELVVVNLLKALGREVHYRPGATSEEKDWDFICEDLSYEVKTATLGKNGRTFQHESIYRNRKYDGLIFVDITPSDIYITCSDKKEISWSDLHRRKDSTFFKWDTSLSEKSKHFIGNNKITSLKDFKQSFEEMEKSIRNRKLNEGQIREL